MAVVHAFVKNRGAGWDYTLEYLGRFLDAMRAVAAPSTAQQNVTAEGPARDIAGSQATFLALIRQLGQRTAELHRALAASSGDPAFEPEPIRSDDLRNWHRRVRDDAAATLASLREHRGDLPEALQPELDRLFASSETLDRHIDSLVPEAVARDQDPLPRRLPPWARFC